MIFGMFRMLSDASKIQKRAFCFLYGKNNYVNQIKFEFKATSLHHRDSFALNMQGNQEL